VDAKVEKVRDGGPGVSKALVIAHGVPETGRPEILGTSTEGCGTRRAFP
jgi:transposase-like protein